MGNGLSTSGLASGFDTASIIQKLIAAESQPLTTMKNKQTRLTNQTNLLSSIKANLLALQTAASDLTMSSAFGGRKVSSSDSTNAVATAVAQNGAVNTSYTVNVTGVATTTTYVSSKLLGSGSATPATTTTVTSNKYLTDDGSSVGLPLDPTSTTFGAAHLGSFTINGKTITVSNGNSINDVLNTINTSGAGVTASISASNQLVLTQNTTGAIPINVTGSITGLIDSATATTVQGKNAAASSWSAGTYLVKTGSAINVPAPATLNTQFGDTTAPVGFTGNEGNFTINGAKIMVTDTDTLNTVVNKITASAAGVTASIVGGKVVLTQKTVGSTQKIDITNGSGNALATLGIDPATITTTTAGTDADESTPIGSVGGAFAGMSSGYFSINGTYIYVDSTKDTMNTIMSKINQSGAGVIANFNTDSDQITITSKTPGVNPIKFGTYGVPGATDSIDFVHMANLSAAGGPTGTIDATTGGHIDGTEAQVTINGTAVTTKNSSATINGVVFSFVGKGTTTLTVQNDTDTTLKKVQAFISAYNTVNDQIKSVITDKPDSNSTDPTQGILFGDSMLTSLSYSLRDLISQTVGGASSKYMQLSQVGITTGTAGSSVDSAKSGDLTLDTAKLTQALTDNPDAVAALFGKSNRVFAEKTTMDGTKSQVTLATHPLSTAFVPQVNVNGVNYSVVKDASSFSTDPIVSAKQFWVDYKNGTINFKTAPAASAVVSVNYDYDTSNSGMALRFKNIVASYTKYGGSFDATIGSNGSIPSQIKDLGKQMTNMQDRIDQHQARLEKQFTAMETMLASLKSQQNSFNSLLGNLSSSSSK